jgi:hypothetical protein
MTELSTVVNGAHRSDVSMDKENVRKEERMWKVIYKRRKALTEQEYIDGHVE